MLVMRSPSRSGECQELIDHRCDTMFVEVDPLHAVTIKPAGQELMECRATVCIASIAQDGSVGVGIIDELEWLLALVAVGKVDEEVYRPKLREKFITLNAIVQRASLPDGRVQMTLEEVESF